MLNWFSRYDVNASSMPDWSDPRWWKALLEVLIRRVTPDSDVSSVCTFFPWVEMSSKALSTLLHSSAKLMIGCILQKNAPNSLIVCWTSVGISCQFETTWGSRSSRIAFSCSANWGMVGPWSVIEDLTVARSSLKTSSSSRILQLAMASASSFILAL